MKEARAVNDKVLSVDLTSGRVSEIRISDGDRRRYFGGKGLALKLLYDHIKPGIDPLSRDNILVMMTGPTAATPAPTGGRFALAGKSPLTGIFASSLVGGRFGLSLKRAGFDGIMIRGKSDSPAYVSIDDGDVSMKDASPLWGMDTYEVQEAVKDEGDWVVIGPAGENMVRFANLVSGKRVAGRCGLGAVLGSKKLKGLVARGSRRFGPADPETFDKALKLARKKVKSHFMTGTRLPELGTPQNVMIYDKAGIMTVRNYSRTRFDKASEISGEKIREEHYVRNHGCVGCSIQCGRTGNYNGKQMVSPEFETIAMMGSNLQIGSLTRIALWNEKLNRMGLDSISTGNVMGFAMELTENGLLDTDLVFGNPGSIDEMIDDIAYRRGLGNDLAEGVMRLSAKYGGKEYGIHVKGLEMPAYDPRGCTGQGLGYATANSGATHLSGSTHAIEVESYLSQRGTEGKAHFVKFLQDLTDAVNSSIFCIWTQYPFLEENLFYRYTPLSIMRLLMRDFPSVAVATADLSDYCALLSGLLGYKITRTEFYEVGERIFNLERYMNCREGISREDDTLPHRILHEVREDGWPPIELDKMLAQYYRLRGWDKAGRPKSSLMQRLGIPH